MAGKGPRTGMARKHPDRTDEKAAADEAPVADFVGGAFGHRFRQGISRREDLPRACGLARQAGLRIVDATAGLGRDAFVLAACGAEVTLIERSPDIHALLAQGLARAAEAGPAHAEVVARMRLIHGDSRQVLAGLRPDVVLVDPMHPPRGNSALVKKNLRQVRSLVGADADALDLMQVALAAARQRVVLKWPLRASPMAGLPAPAHQIVGKTVRYDVFVAKLGPNGTGAAHEHAAD